VYTITEFTSFYTYYKTIRVDEAAKAALYEILDRNKERTEKNLEPIQDTCHHSITTRLLRKNMYNVAKHLQRTWEQKNCIPSTDYSD